MSNCVGCGAAIAPSKKGPPRKWCSERCRKHACYSGTCHYCGGATYGGTTTPPSTCSACLEVTEDQVIAAMRDFADEYGRAPRSDEFRNPRWPSSTAIGRRFGWNAMLLKAGLSLSCDRRPETQAEIERLLRTTDLTIAEIGERVELSSSAISYRLYSRGLSAAKLRAAA